jgi:hypothetical protein
MSVTVMLMKIAHLTTCTVPFQVYLCSAFWSYLFKIHGIRDPPRYITDFSLFIVWDSSAHDPAVGCTSVATVVWRNVGVFGTKIVCIHRLLLSYFLILKIVIVVSKNVFIYIYIYIYIYMCVCVIFLPEYWLSWLRLLNFYFCLSNTSYLVCLLSVCICLLCFNISLVLFYKWRLGCWVNT